MDGVVPSVSFPNDVFKPAVPSSLRELDPKDVMLEENIGESTSLAASLVRTASSIEAIVSEMEQHGESATLFKRLKTERVRTAGTLHQAGGSPIARAQSEVGGFRRNGHVDGHRHQ
jgi:hypothetical protein